MSPTEITAPTHAALADLVARYDGRAPRYTSYPTAVQFTPQVDETVYRSWLQALSPQDPLSLYVHVPFCNRLCWFCGCNTRAVNRHEPVGEYVQFLLEELVILKGAVAQHLPARALHFGGGTPNMLKVDELETILSALGRAFDLGPDLELSAELDPASLHRDWVAAAAAHGLTRASLGVQNLSPRVQEAVNRRESFEEVARCVAWLRDAGVRSVNLDLMYGLPHQTRVNTLETIDQLLRLMPERVALFGYAHVPWMKAHQALIDERALPGAAERLEQSETAAERLIGAGYIRIGLDHFALPDDDMARALTQGRLHRNFQGYTTDEASTLIGIGASAISSLPQGFVQNIAQELQWRGAVDAGRLPIARGVGLTDEDRLRGEVIERLMCDLAVDLGDVARRHGRTMHHFIPELERLAAFEDDGLVRMEGDRLIVSARGRLVIRSICAVFDQYFDPDGQRHSKAL